MISSPALDTGALEAMLGEQARFGGTSEGGLHRLAASHADGAVREWLSDWFSRHGLDEVVDPIGNQFGIMELAGREAPVLLVGSHLDSQPRGGRLDGAYGVVAACQAALAVRDALTRSARTSACNLAVVNWTNEEGARFQPSLIGSSVYVGRLALDDALRSADGDGLLLGEALEDIGYRGKGTPPSPCAAYVELHVECGPELEAAGLRLGVVSRWWGAVKTTVEFVGAQAHTGPTPMSRRRDALYAASQLITAVRGLADTANAGDTERLRTSVGRIEVQPNSPNVVPGRVRLWIELRSTDPAVLDHAESHLGEEIERAACLASVRGRPVETSARPPGGFDEQLIELVEQTIVERGHPPMRLATVAGHDAVALASVCPSVVINVPSIGGLCHHPDEDTAAEDLIEGAHVLTEVLWRLCRGATLTARSTPSPSSRMSR